MTELLIIIRIIIAAKFIICNLNYCLHAVKIGFKMQISEMGITEQHGDIKMVFDNTFLFKIISVFNFLI